MKHLAMRHKAGYNIRCKPHPGANSSARPGRPLALSILISILLAFVATTPANANLRVCNQTASTISVALGYRGEDGWFSEGWWVADPDTCATVINGDLNSQYYYLFAADDVSGGTWDGPVFMCTRDKEFTVLGVEDCLARGYERTGFFEVDTKNRKSWTLQLTETEVISPGNQ